MKHQNLHTHTTYVDGYVTAEEMVLSAIEKGGDSVGISEHAYVPFDPKYSLKLDDIPRYISEVNALKKKYEGKIEIFLGIEADYFTLAESIPDGLDYIIGAVHHIQHGDEFLTVDAYAEDLLRFAELYFGGDFNALAERYFETVSDIMNKTNADIIGHFDLLTKFNLNGGLFDDTHPRYISAAIDSMKELLKKNTLFEINTGAMFRVGKTEPYPSPYLLRELCERGGEVILSSDSHKPESMYYKFEEMRELVKACGFKYIKRLTKDGFADVKL